jgi:hypothetical protein
VSPPEEKTFLLENPVCILKAQNSGFKSKVLFPLNIVLAWRRIGMASILCGRDSAVDLSPHMQFPGVYGAASNNLLSRYHKFNH